MEDASKEMPYQTESLYIQDGNTLFHGKSLPPTFGAICLQVLAQMVAEKNLVLSTDSYHADSIKG